MPRSSRHKSHKQSKHGSREGKEHSESEKEDVKKVKDRSSGEGSAIRDSGSSEKRKLSKDSSSRDNGSPGEEFVGSKRRKEKADGRWTGEEDGDATVAVKEVKGEILRIDGDNKLKDLKPVGDSKRIDGEKSKHVGDSKSKSSRRHESGSEKKEDNAGLPVEKDESNSSVSRVESKRKSEKDLGPKEMQQNKDSKDKEWALEREKKIIEESKRKEASNVDVEAARKQGEERQGKRSRENTDYPIQDDLRNPVLEKELERRTRKRGDGSTDKDKYQDGAKESEDGRLSSRGERAKDGRYKDEKHKDGSSGDKHREDSERSSRHRDDKYGEDAERDGRRRDFKYGEDGDKYYRHKDNKYCEEDERDNRRKDDKYREDGERDRRQRDGKYREDGDRHKRQNDDKYREGDDRDIRHRDDKYREDADRDNRHRVDKYHEDGGRDRHRGDKYHEVGNRADRYKDDWHVEDGHVDNKSREEKYREDVGRDNRYREGMQREDSDKGKRVRDVNYRDEQSSRDRTSGKSDIKHLRDESNAPAELHNRKLNNRDSSPIFDDQSSRYKDDKGRRRTGDREDHGEIRPRSNTKEQNYEGEKKSLSSMRVELGGDRGRSNSRSSALEITGNHHSRQRNSPSSSSHAMKDQHRLPKHEESKNRDYIHEERVSYNVTSSKDNAEKAPVSRSIDKTLQKNDIRLAEFSAERHPKEDAHPSPLHLVDISPSSTSNDRRQLNRSGVRRNLDMEDSGQRSGGSRDAKSPSQADGDNKSVSSPFSRSSNFSSNPRSLLPPPPPFRMGADSPLVVGSFDDDNRSKPNNRHRRIGDPTIGRAQGSPWRGVPNWPSPMPNGFIPFQHGPPQVGFHPVMQQFPTPPMFSIRPPSMELNQSGVPYHVPDSERFSVHGRPLGWRHTVDDAIHGWDTGNPVFGEESNFYGRPNWDQNNRNLTGGRVWETSSGAMWKGHNSGASTELPSAPDMGDYSGRGQADEVWSGLSGLKAQNEEKHPNAQVESIQVDRSNDAVEKNALETPKAIPDEIPNLPRREDARVSHLYLSMLDVSPDLTEPELLNQYTNLVGMDQNSVSDEDDSKFLLVEEDMDATSNLSNKSSRASLFPTLNNSVLQKAMSLYKKTRVQVRAINGDKVLVFNVGNLMAAVALDQQGMRSNDKPGDMVVCDQQEAGVVNSALTEVKMEMSPELTTSKIDEPFLGDGQEKSEAGTAVLNMVKVELDLVSKQQGTRNSIVEEKSSSPVNVERPDAHSLGKVVEVNAASDSKGNSSVANDVKCGLSLFSDFSKEAVLPESVESVNLSRIHQSPESTH